MKILSKIRACDEIIPRPEHVDVTKKLVRSSFPAEHPFASHISRFAIFPDPQILPTDNANCSQCPSLPGKFMAVLKTKGHAERVETVRLGANGRRQTIEKWPDNEFDQHSRFTRSADGMQTFYPAPPKLFMPNAGPRDTGRLAVSASTSRAIAQAERDRWQSAYSLQNRSIQAPSMEARLSTKQPNFELRRSHNKENMRIGSEGVERVDHQTATKSNNVACAKRTSAMEEYYAVCTTPSPECSTKVPPNYNACTSKTLPPNKVKFSTDVLLNGRRYVNLPENVPPSELHPNYYSDPEHHLHPFSSFADCGKCPEPEVLEPLPPCENYYHRLLRQHQESIQHMEAKDRWRLLESQKPDLDVGALRRKMDLSSSKHHPDVFYDHEGKYQKERSGMYKTSYDPKILAQSLNLADQTQQGSAIMDHTACHVDSLNLMTDMNNDMADVFRYTRPLGVLQRHDQPSSFEVLGPWTSARNLQKKHLEPDATDASRDIRTMEGEVIWKGSIYGSDYNTVKYLQDHPSVPEFARNEPLEVMSHVNQNLSRVPLKCPCPPEKKCEVRNTVQCGVEMRPFTAPIKVVAVPTIPDPIRDPSAIHSAVGRDYPHPIRPTTQSGQQSRHYDPMVDQCGQEPPQNPVEFCPKHYDLSQQLTYKYQGGDACEKAKKRFVSSSQTCFSKHDAVRNFNLAFPERAPDLREYGKPERRHQFLGEFNSQILRGAMFVG